MKKIKVILVRPFCMPELIEINNTYEALRDLVEGYIEMPAFFNDVDIICNEEGKLLGLTPNRVMTYKDEPFDIISGNIVLAGSNSKGETVGLTKKQIEKYMKKFSTARIEIDG